MATSTAISLEQLTHLGWDELPLPFKLNTPEGELVFDKVLRHLPGKRIAGRARWQGITVFAKLFLNSTRHGKQEKTRLDILQINKVATPKPLALWELNDSSLLITDWHASLPIADEPLEKVLPLVVDKVLQLADLGLYQKDLHLDNFLWDGSQLLVIDAGEITDFPLTKKDSALLDSLAMLCAQLPAAQIEPGKKIIEHELKHRQIDTKPLAHRLLAIQQKRIQRMMKKWQRECTAIQVEKLPEGELYSDRLLNSAIKAELLSTLNNLGNLPIIKQGSKVTLYQLNEQWVIKHYFHTSVKTRLKRRLFAGRADISWVMGWTLEQLGIPTPKPVLYLRHKDSQETIVFPLIKGQPLGELIEQNREQASTLKDKAEFWLNAMHQQNIWHGDTKAYNAMIDEQQQVWWIDLDAAGYSAIKNKAQPHIKRDQARWNKNWL